MSFGVSRSLSVVMADGVAVGRLLCCNTVHYRCRFSYTRLGVL